MIGGVTSSFVDLITIEELVEEGLKNGKIAQETANQADQGGLVNRRRMERRMLSPIDTEDLTKEGGMTKITLMLWHQWLMHQMPTIILRKINSGPKP